jgi:hypothetical protein
MCLSYMEDRGGRGEVGGPGCRRSVIVRKDHDVTVVDTGLAARRWYIDRTRIDFLWPNRRVADKE